MEFGFGIAGDGSGWDWLGWSFEMEYIYILYILYIYGVLVGIHYILYVVYVGLSKLRSFNHLHRQTDRLRKNVFDQF